MTWDRKKRLDFMSDLDLGIFSSFPFCSAISEIALLCYYSPGVRTVMPTASVPCWRFELSVAFSGWPQTWKIWKPGMLRDFFKHEKLREFSGNSVQPQGKIVTRKYF